MTISWKLVIHGGAGAMRPVHGDEDHEERARQGLRNALEAGSAILNNGASAVDAVEAAVRVLEDDPCFNAGRGSTLNAQGIVELEQAAVFGDISIELVGERDGADLASIDVYDG